MEHLFGLTVQNMKENGKKIKHVDLASLIILTVILMKDIGKIIKHMDKVLI